MTPIKTISRSAAQCLQYGLLIGIFVIMATSALAQCPKPGLVPWKTFINGDVGVSAIADVNGDGKPDLARSDAVDTVKIALGLGAGQFAPAATYATGGGLVQPIFGDLNGDGKPEMLIPLPGQSKIDVWMNNGSGGLSFSNSVTESGTLTQVADFTGDGKGDLFLVTGFAVSSATFSVRAGNGVGGFVAPVVYAPGSDPYFQEGAVVGDFNGDGRPDVAANTVSRPGTLTMVRVKLYLNNGSGTLVLTSSPDVGAAELALATDLNGDGKSDLIGINRGGSTATVLLNQGGTAFIPHAYTVKPLPSLVGEADFNGDGKKDLYVTYTGLNPVGTTVLIGDGMGGVTRSDLPKSVLNIPAADFDGDGRTDFWESWSNVWTQERLFFLRQTTCSAKGDPRRIDFDGNGFSEYAVFRPSNGVWSRRTNLFSPITSTQFGANGDLLVPGDFDGDGRTDQAVFRPGSGTWYVLRSTTQSFYGVQFGASGDKPVPGDYDGDGTSDIAVYRPSNGGWYYLNSSDGSLHGVTFGLSSDAPVPADLDGDGKVDVTVFRSSEGVWYSLSSSTGAFSGQQWGALGDIAVAKDYDGDGRDDIAVWRPGTGNWYVLRSYNGAMLSLHWGAAGDIPVIGFTGVLNLAQAPPYAIPVVYRPGVGFYTSFSGNDLTPLGSGNDIPASSVYPVQ